ncbi:hypothetical protein FACS189450_06540 [Spirochaetia bacterium]|nr:hypothetical protein FACS189450_06540 [Spirochaetia bacterium]
MAEKLVRMTSSEIRKKYGNDTAKIKAMLESAPEFDDDITDDDVASGRIRPVGRGFAAFKEHINRNGRPTVADKTVSVSIRLPKSIVDDLRTEKNFTRKISDYIVNGIKDGKLKIHPVA